MTKIVKIIDKALSVWCIILMSVLTAGVIVSVILRYMFNISFVQSEEGITLVFVATTYFGMALGVRERDHIAITYFADISPKTLRTAIRIFIMILIVVVSSAVFQQSLLWITKVGDIPSPAIGIPYKYFYVMVPISSVLMIFYAVVDILAIYLPVEPADRGYETDEEIAGITDACGNGEGGIKA